MPAKNVEEIKAESNGLRGSLHEEIQDGTTAHVSEEAAQLLKFHGSYQQDDRDQRIARKQQGLDKAWIFMIRAKIPGGALTAEQYLQHDRAATELGNGTLRITTRQDIQFHGVLKGNLKSCLQQINGSGITTWGGCGDVVRNTIAPAAPLKDEAHEDAQRLAHELSRKFLARSRAYAEIWLDGEKLELGAPAAQGEADPIYEKHYLPRKFKIGIAIPPRNDVDIYSNDLGFISHVVDGRVLGYTVVVGGGFGMSHGKTDTYPALAKPLFYIPRDQALDAAMAVVLVQRDYGNRTDRKRARLKYLIDERGIDWFRDEVCKRFRGQTGPPRNVRWDTVGDLLGWHPQGDGRWFRGVWVQEGRVADAHGVNYKSAFRTIVERFRLPVRLTTNCNLIFADVLPEQRAEVDRILAAQGVPQPATLTPMRQTAQACVGLPTCGLALAESERAFPAVLDEIETVLSELSLSEEPILIRMTGCPNGCARPYNADIAFVGRAPGKYALYVGGSITGDRLAGLHAKTVNQEEIPARVRELLSEYVQQRLPGETFTAYWGRTHENGPAPHPSQFHVELAQRAGAKLEPAGA
ncbi:MAG: NADPH-dependent assimilatory sulfite reductase hemoprotein subunit [Verrucomicrobia bacterium]|nr:NADPH-dependent assimilatory sulfite reductase hemoprotein subunit [Verrucomicrobiota bacterium]